MGNAKHPDSQYVVDLGLSLGFSQVSISQYPTDLRQASEKLQEWLAAGMHGEMSYLARHAALRADPQQLLPGVRSIISVSLDYWPESWPQQKSEQSELLSEHNLAKIAEHTLVKIPEHTPQNSEQFSGNSEQDSAQNSVQSSAQNSRYFSALVPQQPSSHIPSQSSTCSPRSPTNSHLRGALDLLEQPENAYISRYALGRDYHRTVKQKLKFFAQALTQRFGAFDYRLCTDSAPIMEIELAEQNGLGWRGKNTLLLNRHGSLHFLGEMLCTLQLSSTPPCHNHCGHCQQCLTICPTAAIIAPYQLDARRCISYLTIEYAGSIPLALRPLIGNRIYGCDDCQLVCPWNRFARIGDPEFLPRPPLAAPRLHQLMSWSEAQFLERLTGSPIRRIGHVRWLRNIAVALGNAAHAPPSSPQQATKAEQTEILAALQRWANHDSDIVREHVHWALSQWQAL